jgi:tetratricopeptide (TPR) repeat protein
MSSGEPLANHERVSGTAPDAGAASRAAPKNRLVIWLLRGLVVCCAIGAAGWLHHSVREGRRRAAALQALPAVEVPKHDPEMARLIESGRAGVVADPFSGKAWGHYGNILLAQELFLQAADCYAQAERLNPEQVRWPYLRGLCIARTDRLQAMACFRRAAELDRGFEFVDLPLSELLLFEGKVDEAESYLLRAARVAPEHPRVQLGQARIALVRGQLDDALQWAEAAGRGMPPRRDIQLVLCQIHQQRGDAKAVDEQMKLLETLPELPADNAWDDPFLAETTRYKIGTRWTLMVAQELLTSGRPTEALNLLRQKGAERSDNFNMVLLLGRAYSQSNYVAEAKRTLERAMSMDPQYPTVHFELGNLAAGMEQWSEAVTHYRKTLECNPGFSEAYLNIGVCQRAMGNSQQAIASFREACRRLPQNAAAHFELAQLLHETNGALDEVRKFTDRAAELDPHDPRIRELLERLQ